MNQLNMGLKMTHHGSAAFTSHLSDLCSLHRHAGSSSHKNLNLVYN